MQTRIDHLVIGAKNLQHGVEYVKELLGVEMPFGGVHPKMGTHNHLMRLGENIFLEIISINDEIDPPKRPRWFDLDNPFIKKQIETTPRLLTWVVNTTDIKALIKNASFPAGKAELITRGNLSWFFGLPEDGRLFGGGMLPYIIQWETDRHPASDMADFGCTLAELRIYHPHPEWLKANLDSIGASKLVTITTLPHNSTPYMTAIIKTPSGIKMISSQ